MSASKVPSRRPPGRQTIPRVDGRAESAPALRPEAVGRRAVGLASNATVAALEAELAREKAGRAADADHMGEMLVRVATAENERRRAELAADALAERVGALEIELKSVRGQLEAERKVSVPPGPSLDEAEDRARAAEARALEFGARTADAEAARDRAMHEVEVLHVEADELRVRLRSLEEELSGTELALEDARASSQAASDRARHLELELEALATQAEEARRARDAMHHELETARSEITRLHAERDDALADMEAVLLSRSRNEKELEGLGESLADARRRVEEAEIVAERERATRSRLDEELRRLESELVRLETELARSRAEAGAAVLASDEATRATVERENAITRARDLLADLEERDRKVNELRRKALEQALAWLAPVETDTRPAESRARDVGAPPSSESGPASGGPSDASRAPSVPATSPADLELDFSDVDVDSLS